MICVVKCTIDIPCLAIIYLQQDSFWLAYGALCAEYFLAKGGNQIAIQMLVVVADKNVKGVAVAMFMLI